MSVRVRACGRRCFEFTHALAPSSSSSLLLLLLLLLLLCVWARVWGEHKHDLDTFHGGAPSGLLEFDQKAASLFAWRCASPVSARWTGDLNSLRRVHPFRNMALRSWDASRKCPTSDAQKYTVNDTLRTQGGKGSFFDRSERPWFFGVEFVHD